MVKNEWKEIEDQLSARNSFILGFNIAKFHFPTFQDDLCLYCFFKHNNNNFRRCGRGGMPLPCSLHAYLCLTGFDFGTIIPRPRI